MELQKNLEVNFIEVDPGTPLIIGIQYPPSVGISITANAAWCSDSQNYSCKEIFHSVSSPGEVRNSLGNTYHLDTNGFLTVRIIMTPQTFTGTPEWIFPDYSTVGKWGNGVAIDRFSRDGITLPKHAYGPWLNIDSECSSPDGVYCSDTPVAVSPVVCSEGFEQISYDKCCLPNLTVCENAAI